MTHEPFSTLQSFRKQKHSLFSLGSLPVVASIIMTCAAANQSVSAATITLPDVIITGLEDHLLGGATTVTGVSSRLGFGTYTLGSTPSTIDIVAGDILTVTIRATEGKRFHVEADLPIFANNFLYGELLGVNNVLSPYTMNFDGLTGGSAPVFGLIDASTVGPVGFFEGPAYGLSFSASMNGNRTSDVISFDSITWSGTAANPGTIILNTEPVQFELYTGEGGMSLIPVPEPSSSVLLCLAGTLMLTRRKRLQSSTAL